MTIRNLFDSPLGPVWTRGNSELLDRIPHALSITGARSSTAYGSEVSAEFAAALTADGHTIITGAAFGIESAAVRGSLASGGNPIVVLPCGVDLVYPRAHEALLNYVAESGLIIGLSKPGTVATRERFLHRLQTLGREAAATIIIEAADRSGSLTQATAAMVWDKPVAAVPGPITSTTSRGSNRLLSNGATLIGGTEDLLAFGKYAIDRHRLIS